MWFESIISNFKKPFAMDFYAFPFNPISNWTAPIYKGVYKRFWRFYLGTEIKTKLDNKIEDLENNFHIGIASVKYRHSGLNARYFLQYGYGNDYLNNEITTIYPILQFGVSFNLLEIKR